MTGRDSQTAAARAAYAEKVAAAAGAGADFTSFMWHVIRSGPGRLRLIVYCAPCKVDVLRRYLSAHGMPMRLGGRHGTRTGRSGALRSDRPRTVSAWVRLVDDRSTVVEAFDAYESAWATAKRGTVATVEQVLARDRAARHALTVATYGVGTDPGRS